MNDNEKYFPMNSAELLDSVLDVYKKSFFKQIGLSVIFQIILMIIIYLFIFLGVLSGVVFFLSSFQNGDTGSMIIFFIILAAVALVVITFYSALISTGNALITKKVYLKEKTDLGQVIKESFKMLPAAASTALANAIIMLPVFVLLGLFLFVYFLLITQFIDNSGASIGLLALLTVAMFIVIAVATVVISAFCMMSIAVSVFEKKYFFSAVIKSFKLAKPDFFKIVGLVTIWTMVTVVGTYSITGLAALALFLAETVAPANMAAYLTMLTIGASYIINPLIAIILSPLSGIFATMLYINQRMKYEGLDIELNLSDIKRAEFIKRYNDMYTTQPHKF
ncbi:MAG: hypothetical protein LBU94_03535 [Clostridiales bacterium]|jgi:hypothetical protein|nr:hypothetical protein [Clostridiales bacterium]